MGFLLSAHARLAPLLRFSQPEGGSQGQTTPKTPDGRKERMFHVLPRTKLEGFLLGDLARFKEVGEEHREKEFKA